MTKLHKTKKDPELYYYFTAKKEKRWMFRHRYYDELGKRREKSKQSFTSENEAYRKLLEVRIAISNGDTKQVENSNITVSEWLDIWYETKHVGWEITTQKDRKRYIDDIYKPRIGKYKLSKLDGMTYEREFINDLLEDYAPSSIKLFHNTFKIAINAAVTNEVIKKNNISHITIPERNKKEDNFLSQSELNKLLNAAKSQTSITMNALFFFIANTGVRKGEAHGLRWRDIDFKNRIIEIERTRDEHGIRPPKTLNSYRSIPVDINTINNLKEYRSWCKQKKFKYGEHLKEDNLVFISNRGGIPVSHNAINQALSSVIEKNAIKKITPHGLRHTHATILLNKGVSVATVAKRLGNTAEEIHRTYGHSDEDADLQAVEIFSKAINS